jgi:hypothetical protein
MTRSVDVDRRGTEYVVTSYTQKAPGSFWRMNGHFQVVPLSAPASMLGHVILDAIEASNTLPFPQSNPGTKPIDPVLDALGVRSYAQYMKGTRGVTVRMDDDDVLRITPQRNEGARGGFVPITDKQTVVEDRSADAIGDAIEVAMGQAEA